MNRTFGHRVATSLWKQFLHPSYGTCSRCGTPWACTSPHPTAFEWRPLGWRVRGQLVSVVGRSMFPLCDDCWGELGTPEARLPFYVALAERWRLAGLKRDLTPEHLLECLQREAAETKRWAA